MKKDKTFGMYFGVWKTVVLAIVLVGVLALIALDIAMLAGATKLNSPAVAGVSLAAAVIVGVMACVVLFNSYYRLDDEQLVVMLGVFKDKVRYDNMRTLKQNADTGELFLITKDDMCLRLNVSPASREQLSEGLAKRVEGLAIETFVLPKRKK